MTHESTFSVVDDELLYVIAQAQDHRSSAHDLGHMEALLLAVPQSPADGGHCLLDRRHLVGFIAAQTHCEGSGQ